MVAVPLFALRVSKCESCRLLELASTEFLCYENELEFTGSLKFGLPPVDSPQTVDFRIRKRRSTIVTPVAGATGHLVVLRPSDFDGVPRRTFRRRVHTFDDALGF